MMAQDGIDTDSTAKKPTSTRSSAMVSSTILSLQSSNVTLSLTTSALAIDGMTGGVRVSLSMSG